MATATKSKKNTKNTKNTAAKKAPAAKKEAKVVPIKPETEETKEKAPKGPWLKTESMKWAKVFARVTVLSGRLTKAQERKHSPDLVDAIEVTTALKASINEIIETLQDGDEAYVPAGRLGGGKTKADVGSVVCLTEKAKEKYADLLEEEEMVDLTVLKVKGAQLIVKSKATEEKFKIPRGQVRVQDEE